MNTATTGLLLSALLSFMRTFGAAFERPPVYSATFGVKDGAQIMEVADSFSLQSATAIDKVQWWGGSSIPAPNEFIIRIYAEDAGVPGRQLFEANVAAALGSQTGFVNNSPPIPLSSYSATLPSPFVADANNRYWMSIGNSKDLDWGWQISTGASPYGVMRRYVGDSWNNNYGGYGDHAAFALFAVPEPTTITLFGLGLLPLVIAALNRHRRNQPKS